MLTSHTLIHYCCHSQMQSLRRSLYESRLMQSDMCRDFQKRSTSESCGTSFTKTQLFGTIAKKIAPGHVTLCSSSTVTILSKLSKQKKNLQISSSNNPQIIIICMPCRRPSVHKHTFRFAYRIPTALACDLRFGPQNQNPSLAVAVVLSPDNSPRVTSKRHSCLCTADFFQLI